MKRTLLTLLTAFLVFCFAEVSFSGSREPGITGVRRYVPNEIIVKFKDGLSEEHINQINRRHATSVVYTSPFAGFKRIRVPSGKTAEQMVGLYNSEPDVEYAELNYYAYASFVPDDPLYSRQWHFNDPCAGINIESAWDITAGEPNTIIAVVDTGVAYEDCPAPDHWHIDTYRAYGDAGHSWWCGADNPEWAKPPGYGNGWKDYLQHSFDLTAATGTVTLTYQYRHDLEVTAGIAYDKAFTEISTNGGNSWTILKTYTGKSKVGGRIRWKQESIDLSSYAGNNVLVRFRVYTDEVYSDEDGDFDSDGAFFIDEVKLEDGSGVLFYDNVESGAGVWETTKYEQAPDLAGTSFVAGYDFINNDTHPNDDEGHGTHVTGTIAQTTNNNLGVAGIAFNAAVMPVKVLDAAGSGSYQQVADGICYAVDNGAKVINLSLSGSSPAAVLENAVAYAYNNGVTVIAAAGNSSSSSCEYPAAYDSYVIAVGATQCDRTRAPYSNYGPSLDLVAPGGNTGVDQNGDGYVDGVLQQTFGSTPVDWGYALYQGTSMAAPHVSGIAALLISTGVTDPNAVREALQSTARDLGLPGWDIEYGWGLVDAYAALNYYHVPGDFNYDGLVDFKDLAKLSAYWLNYDPLVDIAPVGGDNIVNFLDFAKFAENWD